MNFKKIVAAVAAAAVAVTTMAVSAFAIDLDAEYAGDWNLSAAIPKADLVAIGGDVQISVTLEAINISDSNPYVLAPSDAGTWAHLADASGDNVAFTGTKLVAKPDGFFQIKADQTNLTFVMPADAIAKLSDNGLAFQVFNVHVKSAELSAGTAGDPIVRVSDADTIPYCNGTFDPFAEAEATPAETEVPAEDAATEDAAEVEEIAEEAEEVVEEDTAEEVVEEDTAEEVVEEDTAVEEAPVVEEAPAADTTTPVAATGNTTAAAIVAVMAVAGAAAVASKRK